MWDPRDIDDGRERDHERAAAAAVRERMRARRMNRRAIREMWSYAGLICLVARSASWFAYVNGLTN